MCTTSLHFHRVACRYRGLIGRLLIVVTILLAPTISMAQQPAPTPTLAPGEFVASKPEDIVGIWKTRFAEDVAYIQYNADGTFTLASTLEALENDYGRHGTFWFEGTVFHVKGYGDEGTYEIRVKTEGDTRVHLSFRVIDDPSRARAQDYERGMPRFDPSRASGEFVASKPEDIVGIWQTRFWSAVDVAYLKFNANGTSILASTLEALENDYGNHGTFWFEGTVFHIEEKNSQGTGTYEVRVKTEGDTRVYLSFQVINDPHRARAQDYERGMPRFDLSLQASE